MAIKISKIKMLADEMLKLNMKLYFNVAANKQQVFLFIF